MLCIFKLLPRFLFLARSHSYNVRYKYYAMFVYCTHFFLYFSVALILRVEVSSVSYCDHTKNTYLLLLLLYPRLSFSLRRSLFLAYVSAKDVVQSNDFIHCFFMNLHGMVSLFAGAVGKPFMALQYIRVLFFARKCGLHKIETASCHGKFRRASINCIWSFSFPLFHSLYCLLTQFFLHSYSWLVLSIDFHQNQFLVICLLAYSSKCFNTHTDM